ncbi:DMT family transporter [Streptomyces sp. NPDC050704]|uniref:DMT family transporter n=1 Tax=Streptomyces sp. NPDC050704 TaxID=3157219 RepID=UPI003445FD4F
MNALVLSVLLSLVSAVAYAGGAIVQEQVAASTPGQSYAPMRQVAWWIAVGLNGLGGLLHVVALAYGPLSLVQPLGALTIVFALPMAAVFVRRRAGATAWRGAIMATVGLAVLLALVSTADSQSLNSTQRVVVALVTGGAVVALMMAARAVHRHPAVRSILLAIAAGVAFGMSSVFTKTVAVDWTGGVSLADLPSLAVIGVLATAGMLLSQASYRGAGLAAPLATLTVVNPIVAAAVGLTMFGETFRYGETGTALALGAGVVAAGGLILLTTERISSVSGAELPEQPVPAAAGAPEPEVSVDSMNALPGRFTETAVLPEQPVAVEQRLVSAEQLVPTDQLVSAGVRDDAGMRNNNAVARNNNAEVREKPLTSRDKAGVRDVREKALASAGGPVSAREEAFLPPSEANGPPAAGETPDATDDAPWPGAYYGLAYLPMLLPAPMGIRSTGIRSGVKS